METLAETITVAMLRDESRLLRIDATDPDGWIAPALALASAYACERAADAMVRDARIARSNAIYMQSNLRLVK